MTPFCMHALTAFWYIYILLLHGKMKSAMYVACLSSLRVSVCVCLCIINKICPLASVASFGDIAIIFSEQLGIAALRR